MKDVFSFIGFLFILGGIGTVLNNRKLDASGRKGNWAKYFFYFLIVLTVIATVLIDKKLFSALFIIVSSVGVTEMMDISNKSGASDVRKKILVLSLFAFNLIFSLFIAFVLLPENVIIYTYTIVLTFDGGGQIFGRLFGKRKITPTISPNKTWGGFIYGSMLALLSAFFIRSLVYYSWWQSLVFGVVVCLSAFSGDILASAFKRAFGAKDFSKILPGQGGMFDRFDSFLFSGAVIGMFGIIYLSVNEYDKDVLLYMSLTSLFLFILLVGEFLYLFLSMKAEFARMIAHVLAGLSCLLLLNKFSSEYFVLGLCVQSAIFLYLTYKMGFLKSHHDVARKTNGSPLFFVGILLSYYVSLLYSDKWLFILPLLILTFCDPIAAYIGMTYKSSNWKNLFSGMLSPKTYIGSATFFITTFMILHFGLSYFINSSILTNVLLSVGIAIVVTIAEAISSGGYDNISIPVTVLILLLLVRHFV